MIIVGIDPGKNGAIVHNKDGKINIFPMPLLENEDLNAERLKVILIGAELIVIEKVHAMPKQGVCSMFSFGNIYGAIKAVSRLSLAEILFVTPQKWKKEILKGTLKDKDAAINYCLNIYPDVSLKFPKQRVNNHNIADALCLMEYGIKQYKEVYLK